MSQCPYRIKDANQDGTSSWSHCKLREGHEPNHEPYTGLMTRGDRSIPKFDGEWIPCPPKCVCRMDIDHAVVLSGGVLGQGEESQQVLNEGTSIST